MKAVALLLISTLLGCAAVQSPQLSRGVLSGAQVTLSVHEADLMYRIRVLSAKYSSLCVNEPCSSEAARRAYAEIFPESVLHDDAVLSYNRAAEALDTLMVCETERKTCTTEQGIYVLTLGELALRIKKLSHLKKD